ncbi:hypothetical protein BPUTEOMOX_695 [methanotrophic endosymbiont of Bathymodiolus puteoserpentis (Logatchev)]|nr:hypothetical protein BPUTEOMOX_695 [methanotrophic endosymbiont of Bathymodiolus puteoserpentis (Logatchev)]
MISRDKSPSATDKRLTKSVNYFWYYIKGAKIKLLSLYRYQSE